MNNISEEIKREGIQEGINLAIKNLTNYLIKNNNLTEKEALKKAKEILYLK